MIDDNGHGRCAWVCIILQMKKGSAQTSPKGNILVIIK